MKYLILCLIALSLTSCTQYVREVKLIAKDHACITVGDIEVLAEVTKGDENLTNTPDVKPSVTIPLP
jgi:hypothetical protein